MRDARTRGSCTLVWPARPVSLAATMRTPDDIRTMIGHLEIDIERHGFDASVDAASRALEWALGEAEITMLDRYMARSDADRRREWIARGGDPAQWPKP